MKRNLLRKGLLPLMLVAVMATLLTSCVGDSYWYDDYDDGFYDRSLDGYWELVQANSMEVKPGEENYIFFNGRGRGLYFFYENGRRYTEDIYYICQDAYGGNADYQVNIQYGNGRPTTTDYWFTHGGNTLWMQWREGGRIVTYVYDRIPRAPW